MAGGASELNIGWDMKTLVQTDPDPMAVLYLGLRQIDETLQNAVS